MNWIKRTTLAATLAVAGLLAQPILSASGDIYVCETEECEVVLIQGEDAWVLTIICDGEPTYVSIGEGVWEGSLCFGEIDL